MKNIAIGIMLVFFLSVIIEPLVEMALVFKENVVLSTAINNACRVAKDRSLEYESLRGLDAEIDEEKFKEYFSDAFESAMDLTLLTSDGDTLEFKSNDSKYNDFQVTLNFSSVTNYETEQLVTKVEIKAESTYKFKTQYLKLAEAAGEDVDYKLISERTYLLSVKN
ncbi:hypothetical protein BSK52_11585 [Paenibacillus odorifer]|uniref:Uncharacterized protein n=2 Tax=Paenibacillus odorifer TaxID=189426 RepID=A0A1R0Y156_9BACL|nr:hypothetical protein BSK52_11585 [Paenibacillus odorifer]